MSLTTTVVSGLIAILFVLLAWTGIGQWRIERQHPPVGRFITVDGVRLHYVEAGSGSPIVLVHGASSNLNEFTTSILPALATQHRVIAFDRPGYGYSERPRGDAWLDPTRVARLLLDAADQLGAHHPLLVGHSWAGSVVMAAQVEMPERIAGGVMLSGVAGHWAGPLNWTYEIGDIPLLGPLFAWAFVYPLGQFMVDAGVAEVLAPDPVPAGHVDKTAVALALRPRQFLINVQDTNNLNLFMQELSPRYERIHNPLLLIHGENDTLVPFWNHGKRVLPVVRQAELVLLPETGHAPHHTHTAEVTRAIADFYARARHAELARHVAAP